MSDAKKIDTHHEEYIMSVFNSLDVFSAFPKNLLGTLATYTSTESYKKGEVILSQNEENQNLYFLIKGVVDVTVDGGLVASLDKTGDLIGEMSVISNRPSSATTLAATNVDVFVINSSEALSYTGEDNLSLHLALYKLFASILTHKLNKTNEKAKHFEDLSEELKATQVELQKVNELLEEKVMQRTKDLEEKTRDAIESHHKLERQNAELIASNKKIEELYNTRDLTFKKLEELQNGYLSSLSLSLANIKLSEDKESQRAIAKAEKKVKEVMALLEPITLLFSTERAMKNKKVLLADTNSKQQVIAKMALGGTGVELSIASSLQEAKLLLDDNAFNIIFVSTDMLELADYAQNMYPGTKFVFITSESIPEYLPKLEKHSFIPNIVSRDKDDRTFTIKNIMTTVTKLISQDIFGIDKYLAWGANTKSASVKSSSDRMNLINDMTDYFLKLGMRKSNLSRCQTVVEELLMNAIYDAPKDATGLPLYNHLSRQETIVLKPEHYATLKYGCDGVLMAVSVEDPFGGLSADLVLTYLASCYGGKSGALNANKGGAGRGLHQIIENSDLVVFNVSQSLRTEVIALFNVDPKLSADKNPSFHFFNQ
ncbi:MAG: cyclic nucleotide-binding domain-containing protein [Bdellovibrionales bacterium]|nr:cyclic nucleotide-binding domain-containing protein [Bdellovibrionales bacterium]